LEKSAPVQNDNAVKSGPYAIFRNHDFLFYLLARVLASFGQQMLTVAIMWELYERTNSPLALGLVGLSQFLPMVLMTLPSGHVADRYDRRKVIMTMQLIMIGASIGLGAVSFFKADVFWVYMCLIVLAVARTFHWSASAAFLPQLVSREDFPQAVNWSSSSFQFSSVAGPAIGGALIAFFGTAKEVYLINTLMILGAFSMMSLVKAGHAPAVKESFSLSYLLGGFRFVFNSPLILAAITLDLFAVLFGGATALLPVFAKDILRVGPMGLGILQASLPIGSLICALYMAHRPPLQKAGRALLIAVVIFGVATVGFGLSKSFALSVGMLLVCGFVDNISVLVRHTLVQLHTPDEMRGRVSAVNNLFIGTSNELGGFESGLVGKLCGPVASVVLGGVATVFVVAVVFSKWPQLRHYGRLGEEVKNG